MATNVTEKERKPMETTIARIVITWHRAGYSLDEITPLVPQVPKAEVAAIIKRCDKETVE